MTYFEICVLLLFFCLQLLIFNSSVCLFVCLVNVVISILSSFFMYDIFLFVKFLQKIAEQIRCRAVRQEKGGRGGRGHNS